MNEAPVPGLILASIIAAGAVAILCWLFVWRYSRVHWQRTAEGRHLMRLTGELGLTFTLTVVFATVPNIPPIVRAITTLVLFGAIAAEMWARITLLHFAQRDHEQQEE